MEFVVIQQPMDTYKAEIVWKWVWQQCEECKAAFSPESVRESAGNGLHCTEGCMLRVVNDVDTCQNGENSATR